MLPKTGNVFPGAGGGVRLEMSASIDVAARRLPARGWQPAIDRRNAHRHALLYYRDFRSAWSNSTTPWASIWVAGGAIWKISPHKTDPQLMIKLRRSDKCAEGRPWVKFRSLRSAHECLFKDVIRTYRGPLRPFERCAASNSLKFRNIYYNQ
jgi:hypothetical protein